MPPRRRVDQRPPRARARPRRRRRGPNRRSRPGGLPSDSTENRDDPSRAGVTHRRVRRGEQDDRTGRRRRMRAPGQGVRALRRNLRVAGRVRRRGDRHRDAHRDRQDPSADSSRRGGGGRHAAQAEAGHLRRPAHAHDWRHLPARVADELPLLHQLEVGRTPGPVLHHRGGFQLRQVHLLLQDRGGARGRRDSRGTARRDHHLPRAGHAQDGQEERHRSQAAERRDARMHLGHLQRQDGHAHHQQHVRRATRRAVRRRLQDPEQDPEQDFEQDPEQEERRRRRRSPHLVRGPGHQLRPERRRRRRSRRRFARRVRRGRLARLRHVQREHRRAQGWPVQVRGGAHRGRAQGSRREDWRRRLIRQRENREASLQGPRQGMPGSRRIPRGVGQQARDARV
mmetsp:Transcript_12885/g.51830  ORF Transcript_12885/g.51830 Transcript_12885/m.51830 type:complete len:397 (-) Transcript_12885:1890-3080(-)